MSATTRARHRAAALTTALALGLGAGTGAVLALDTAAGADTTLGGFTVSALAEASTVQYEQPNFPVPATPTLELDEGYAATTDNYGPTGSATASTLYPGQVIANSGPELSAFAPGVPLPPAPVWPIEAVSTYPQTPSASTDQPGVTMESTSTEDGNTATAELGSGTGASGSSSGTSPSGSSATSPGSSSGSGSSSPTGSLGSLPGLPSLGSASGSSASSPSGSTAAGSGNPLGATSALGTIEQLSGTSSSTAVGATAVASATATDTGISLLGGLITIGTVTSTASATSDGTQATLTGSTSVTGATVAGQAVTVDSSGVHAASASSPAPPGFSSVQALLTQLGISLTVTNPTDAVNGPQGSRQLDGLRIEIDLSTLDQQADHVGTLLPPSLIAQLPLPIPDKQQMVWDLGTVDVQSTAEPAFVVPATSGAASSPAATGAGTSSAGLVGTGDLGATTGTGDSFGSDGPATTGSGSTAPSAGSGSGGSPLSTAPASSISPIFKGVGGGLVVLALLGAGLLAYASNRANSALEAADGTTCPDGGAPADSADPLTPGGDR